MLGSVFSETPMQVTLMGRVLPLYVTAYSRATIEGLVYLYYEYYIQLHQDDLKVLQGFHNVYARDPQ